MRFIFPKLISLALMFLSFITGLVLEASDNSNIYEATNITDTVSGTFSEPTDGEVMTAKEFNDYVTQTTEMLKMNSGL